MDSHFKQTLDRATEIVSKWPAWKQNIIEFTAMATRPVPRQPVPSNEGRPPLNPTSKTPEPK